MYVNKKNCFFKTSNILLFILLLLVILSYHPEVMSLSNIDESGTIFTKYIYIDFILLALFSIKINSLLKSKFIKNYIFLLVIHIFTIVILSVFFEINVFGSIKLLLFSFISICIGYSYNFTKQNLRLLLFFIVLLSLFVLLSQVFRNVGGFVLQAQYLADAKNLLGVLGATSSVISFLLFLENDTKISFKLIYLFLFILILACLLTIRARAATLTVMIMLFLFLVKKLHTSKRNSSFMKYLFILLLVLILLPHQVYKYIYDSFFIAQESQGTDILSGRGDRNLAAIKFLMSNPFLGNLTQTAPDIGWVHNYPLLQIFTFGIVGAFWSLILYIYLFLKLIKCFFYKNLSNIANVGYIILIIPFLISMAEPTLPYGPGTATLFNFILFGISLKFSMESNILTRV